MSDKELSTDQILSQIVNYLRQDFSATKIYLFGSRAKGTAHAQSDYDFVVVTQDKNVSKWSAFEKAKNQIFENFGVMADVWVYCETDFNDWSDEFGSIPETAKNTGIEL